MPVDQISGNALHALIVDLQERGVGFVFTEGGGTRYDNTERVVYLDTTEPVEARAERSDRALADVLLLDAIEDILDDSPTGRDALEALHDGRVPIEIADRRPGTAHWDSSLRKIVLARGGEPDQTALILVHELHHAETYLEGRSATLEIETLDQDEFVRRKVEEEAEGTWRSIEMKRELVAGGEDVSEIFPLEEAYGQAYDAAVAAAGGEDEETRERIGREAGRAAVLEGFWSGEARPSSNPAISYPEHYQQDWARFH